MVVGRRDKEDVDYEKTADIRVGGRVLKNQDVYGDRSAPVRRDVFVETRKLPERFQGDLPENARVVRWMGESYPARLSFRFGKGGSAIPVYEFFLDSENRSELERRHGV